MGDKVVSKNLILKWTDFNRHLLQGYIKKGDTVLDATMGNGHDTLMLAELVGKEGRLYAFDIQSEAIEKTNKLIAGHIEDSQHIQLIEASHAEMDQYIQDTIDAVVFNLGYLPKGDHHITTKAEDTIHAIDLSLGMLREGGILSMVLYSGHAEGAIEKEKIISYVKGLDNKKYHCILSESINQKNSPPSWILITKR